MKKIKIADVSTEVAEKNFSELLKDNKTYFLNGPWGSGKTRFTKGVERISDKDFVYLDLWNIKDDRTVINIAFDKFTKLNPTILKLIIILCVGLSLLMTEFTNLGFVTLLTNWGLDGLIKIFGVIALIVATMQFLQIKSDQIYVSIFNRCNFIFSNKALIIDDFDRIIPEKQEDAYKLFNILNGKLPIVFLGDFTKITKNGDNYLQKIIDRQIDLPYALHPKSIWSSYFIKIEKKFEIEMLEELKAIFINENRNIREQIHFNDYVNLEFFEREKFGHIQINQQLTVIYLYLFHKDYYQQLLNGWIPEFQEKISSDLPSENLFTVADQDNMKFKNDLEETIYQILFNNTGYPASFGENRQGYFIFETISNLSISEAENMLEDDAKLKDYIIKYGKSSDDFFQFVISKYKEWWPHTNQEILLSDMNGEKINLTSEIVRIERVAFQQLKDNNQSNLIDFIVQEIQKRNQLFLSANSDLENAKNTIDFFETNYLNSFELSQKIYFYDHYRLIKFSNLKELFHNDAKDILEEDERYQNETKKPYLLILATLAEKRNWIYSNQWSQQIKKRIRELNDVDLIEFWRLMRIFQVKYKTISDYETNRLSEIEHITIVEGYYPRKEMREEEQNYRDLIDFSLFEERLNEIAGKIGFEIIYISKKTQDNK
ncbi:hypothetical protein [Enterococcus sp. BWR-S5]|uniref:hypothetical protein n=1 Tax=Enterococcus sp. BWR-S5 TaxID=2787714 RepID=UPI0019207DBF|nr:hypothetical protein [Enterococcus sp. BWR-S5]MBL1225861.1 hypothetical protein [Enterococcus sp. BWR-S5]